MPFTDSNITGIAANLLNRRFLGLDKEIQFLEMSKNRRIEIEKMSVRTNYINKIFKKLTKHLKTTSLNESVAPYSEELPID